MKTVRSEFFRLVGILVVIGMLAACAPAAPTTVPAAPTSENVPTSAPAPTGKPAEPITITVWHDYPGTILNDAATRYMADHPGVTIDATFYEPQSYKDAIRVALGAKNAPCVFFSWAGGLMHQYVDAGLIIDLTDRMNANGFKDTFWPAATSLVTYKGSMWAVPTYDTAPAVMFYNKEIFAKYNLEPPKTYNDLLKIVDTLKANGIYPIALANLSKWPGSFYYQYFVDRLGGPEAFSAAADRTGGSFEDPVFIQTGKMIQDLVDRGAFAPGINGLDFATGQDRKLLYAGKAAMNMMGSWEVGLVQSEDPAFFDKMGVFAFPAVDGGKGDPADVVGSIGQNFYSVSSTCANPDQAFEFLQYLVKPETVKAAVAGGFIPPVVGVQDLVENPLMKEILDIVQNAKHVQLWYDQYMPAELAQVHLDTSQALFGKETTPEKAAADMEAAAKQYYGK